MSNSNIILTTLIFIDAVIINNSMHTHNMPISDEILINLSALSLFLIGFATAKS